MFSAGEGMDGCPQEEAIYAKPADRERQDVLKGEKFKLAGVVDGETGDEAES